jgi:hypothetical protein
MENPMKKLIILALSILSSQVMAVNLTGNALTCRLAKDNEVLHDVHLIVKSHQTSLERPSLSVVGQYTLRDASEAENFAFIGKSKYSINKNIVSVKSRTLIAPKPRYHKLRINLKNKTAVLRFKQWPKNIGLGKKELKFKAELFCQEI